MNYLHISEIKNFEIKTFGLMKYHLISYLCQRPFVGEANGTFLHLHHKSMYMYVMFFITVNQSHRRQYK